MDSIIVEMSDLLVSADPGAYLSTTAELLMAYLPCDAVGWNRMDMTDRRIEVFGFPPELFQPDIGDQLLVLADDNPMILSHLREPATPLPSPRRLSDIVSSRLWHETRTYRELLRHIAGEHQLAVGMNGPGYRAAWAFNRAQGDFSSRDLERARRIQPLLAILDRTLGSNVQLRTRHAALTRREEQILTVMAEGLTVYACGHRLGISPRTVAKHLEHAYRKLGCDNLVSALRRLNEHP